MLTALIIAFSVYSRIPMPRRDWTEESMRYAMCFFPLVGAACGVIFWLIFKLLTAAGAPALIRGAVLMAVPLLITGGIHMDGFMDTMDAAASHQSRERKLEILKDSHTGAFAILGCAVYLILYTAFAGYLTESAAAVIPFMFILSRSFSGLSVVTFTSARRGGLLDTFAQSAQKRNTAYVLLIWTAAAAAAMIIAFPAAGLAGVIAAAAAFAYYRFFSYRNFGGTTGDLAGFFLQLAELAALAVVVIASGGMG